MHVYVYVYMYVLYSSLVGNQEQAGEWEQERLELNSEISKLTEQNERLTSELNTRSLTVDKLKNKVYNIRTTFLIFLRVNIQW